MKQDLRRDLKRVRAVSFSQLAEKYFYKMNFMFPY